MKHIVKLVIGLGLLAILLYIGYYSDYAQFITLEQIQFFSKDLYQWTQDNYTFAAMIYMLTFFLVVALGVPATAPVLIAGGFIFGTFWGLLYSVTSGTLGAVISFLMFRFLLRPTVSQSSLSGSYAGKIERFKAGLDTHGSLYLILLHFMFVVPFFVINLLAAVAGISLWRFIWVTVIGFLPCAFVYSFSGRKLLSIRSVDDIFSWEIITVILLLLLVSILPMVYKSFKQKQELKRDSRGVKGGGYEGNE